VDLYIHSPICLHGVMITGTSLHLPAWYSDCVQTGRRRNRGSIPGRDNKDFSYPCISSGAPQPPIQWVPGVFSPVLKRTGREADIAPIRRDEVEIGGTILAPPPPFMAWSSGNELSRSWAPQPV
jgi:hypothetical protein